MAIFKIIKTFKNQVIIELRHAYQELAKDLRVIKFKKSKQTERMVGTEGGELGRTTSGNRPGRNVLVKQFS